MQQLASLSFERIVHEFARWRAVPEQAIAGPGMVVGPGV